MSFDRLAPHYRWMEIVLAGGKLQRCRTAFLSTLADVENVLILGEGNGRFLLECRRRLTAARFTCVDSSLGMITLAKKRLSRAGFDFSRIEFVHASALHWDPPRDKFDLVVTHFFLDCFATDEVKRLIATFAAAARPKAAWLLADFRVPDKGLIRYRAKLIHWLMYSFFRMTTFLSARTVTVPDLFLRSHHFMLQDRRISEWGLLHTDKWVRGRARRIVAMGSVSS